MTLAAHSMGAPTLSVFYLTCLAWACSAYHVCYGFMLDPSDLGWTYTQNLARVWAESKLGTTSFKVENMLFMSDAEQRAAMDMLIDGTAPSRMPCDLIIVGTDVFEDLTYEYALANPNTKFIFV